MKQQHFSLCKAWLLQRVLGGCQAGHVPSTGRRRGQGCTAGIGLGGAWLQKATHGRSLSAVLTTPSAFHVHKISSPLSATANVPVVQRVQVLLLFPLRAAAGYCNPSAWSETAGSFSRCKSIPGKTSLGADSMCLLQSRAMGGGEVGPSQPHGQRPGSALHGGRLPPQVVSGCCSFGKQVWCCKAKKPNYAQLLLMTLRGWGGSMVCPAGTWG